MANCVQCGAYTEYGPFCSSSCMVAKKHEYDARGRQETLLKSAQKAAEREAVAAEASLRLLQRQEVEAEVERQRQRFYSRECPQCAELVKRKAKICKECNHPFDDWEAQHAELKAWEERAARLRSESHPSGAAFDFFHPWQREQIIEAEFWLSPTGVAEYAANLARLEEKRRLREIESAEAAQIAEAELRKREEESKAAMLEICERIDKYISENPLSYNTSGIVWLFNGIFQPNEFELFLAEQLTIANKMYFGIDCSAVKIYPPLLEINWQLKLTDKEILPEILFATLIGTFPKFEEWSDYHSSALFSPIPVLLPKAPRKQFEKLIISLKGYQTKQQKENFELVINGYRDAKAELAVSSSKQFYKVFFLLVLVVLVIAGFSGGLS